MFRLRIRCFRGKITHKTGKTIPEDWIFRELGVY